jgi:glycosyltransferase involved in cell wall biosynthesis
MELPQRLDLIRVWHSSERRGDLFERPRLLAIIEAMHCGTPVVANAVAAKVTNTALPDTTAILY